MSCSDPIPIPKRNPITGKRYQELYKRDIVGKYLAEFEKELVKCENGMDHNCLMHKYMGILDEMEDETDYDNLCDGMINKYQEITGMQLYIAQEK